MTGLQNFSILLYASVIGFLMFSRVSKMFPSFVEIIKFQICHRILRDCFVCYHSMRSAMPTTGQLRRKFSFTEHDLSSVVLLTSVLYISLCFSLFLYKFNILSICTSIFTQILSLSRFRHPLTIRQKTIRSNFILSVIKSTDNFRSL